MKLTDQQIKDLKKFSLILNSMNLEDGVQYKYNCYDDWDHGLDGPTYRGRSVYEVGQLPQSIDILFDDIKNDFDMDNFYNDYYGTANGSLNFEINADKKQIIITYDFYETKTDETKIEHTFQNVVNTTLPWYREGRDRKDKLLVNPEFISEMLKKYGDIVEITYEGSSDSGWLNDEVASSDGETSLDGRLEDITYELLDLYHSGWEINEGSNGTFAYNFQNKTVSVNHNQNYDEEIEENYMTIDF
jgi:hypothetical protein